MRNTLSWSTATVRSIQNLTPTIRQFDLEPETAIAPWSPGSHLDVSVRLGAGPVGRAETRSYSLVGEPIPDAYRIAVKLVAASRGGSRYMWSLQPGDRLAISEPKNLFELQWQAPAHLLIAGGIGITPIVGMALALARRSSSLRMLYAARSSGELAFAEPLRLALGERLVTFAGESGQRLDIAAGLAGLPPDGLAYVCGPMALLDAVRAEWSSSGRPLANLRYETFGNSGRYAPEAFWVRIPSQNAEFTVPADRTLLDVLNEAGIETLSDCRRGECGLCAVDVQSVTGRLDHRDVFLSDHEKEHDQRMCACVSRVVGGGVVLDSAYRPDA